MIKPTYERNYLFGVLWFHRIGVHDCNDKCHDNRQTGRHVTEEVAENLHPMHKQQEGEGKQYWNGAGF